MHKESYILQQLAELGTLSINFDNNSECYLIKVGQCGGWYIHYFNEESLFNALVGIIAQRLKEREVNPSGT